MHILPKISRSKENQAIKLGQLIKYSRNIFLKKSYKKYGEETSPKPYYKKQKLGISIDQQRSEML